MEEKEAGGLEVKGRKGYILSLRASLTTQNYPENIIFKTGNQNSPVFLIGY